MFERFWLTDAQMTRLKPFFPKSHAKPRADDRHVLSGIIFINRKGLRAPLKIAVNPALGYDQGSIP